MKKVLTFGVFDYYHLGHLRLFKNIRKAVGEPCFLIVAMQDGDFILSQKPDAEIMYSTAERMEMLSSVKEIDQVVIYTLVDEFIGKADFDVFARGPDQTSPRFMKFEKWAVDNGKEVLVIPRTEGISSTLIKKDLK